MHAMPFIENQFDIVICGFDHLSLKYLDDKREALVQPNRINSISDIKKLFENKIDQTFLEYDPEMKSSTKEEIRLVLGLEARVTSIIFTVKK